MYCGYLYLSGIMNSGMDVGVELDSLEWIDPIDWIAVQLLLKEVR